MTYYFHISHLVVCISPGCVYLTWLCVLPGCVYLTWLCVSHLVVCLTWLCVSHLVVCISPGCVYLTWVVSSESHDSAALTETVSTYEVGGGGTL